jgi:hypothetical protein
VFGGLFSPPQSFFFLALAFFFWFSFDRGMHWALRSALRG